MKKKKTVKNYVARKAKCPGDMYLIGSTLANIDLRHVWNQTILMGQLRVYWAVDMFSCLIASVHTSFGPPAFDHVTQLLCNAATDKVTFCGKFGIKIDETDWPATGLPKAVTMDRGELLNPRFLMSQGVTIMHGIHSPFNIAPMLATLIDTTAKAISAKGGTAMEPGKACGVNDKPINTAMFNAGLVNAIVDYNKSVQPWLLLTPEMIAAEIEPRPLAVWNWGIQHHSGLLRQVSPEHILSLRLQPGRATVTRRGILFRGISYSSARAKLEGWFERAWKSGIWSMEIHYDPCCVDRIFVIGEKYFCIEDMRIIGESEPFLGLTWAEYKTLQAKNRRETIEHEQEMSRQISLRIKSNTKASSCIKASHMPKTAGCPKQSMVVHEANFIDAIHRHFHVRGTSSKDAYFSLLQDHYSAPAPDGAGNNIKYLKPHFPTYRQFQYFLRNRLGRKS